MFLRRLSCLTILGVRVDSPPLTHDGRPLSEVLLATRRQLLALTQKVMAAKLGITRGTLLVGVLILSNLEHARRVGQVPGVVIPDAIFERLARFELPADQAKVGQDIAVEQCQWVRRAGWDGVYLMSPGGSAAVPSVLQAGLG